jgi:hypothetical protein
VRRDKDKKLKLTMRLINCALGHEDLWGSGGIAPPFLTSAQDIGHRQVSRTGWVTPGGRAPGTHPIGGLVGPRSGQDTVGREKSLGPAGNRTHADQVAAFRYTDSAILVRLGN